MNLEDKLKIGQEVSPSVPTATEDTHAVNLGQVKSLAGRTEKLINNTTQYTILAEDVDKLLKFTANNGEEIQLIYNENTLPDNSKSIVAMSTGDNYLIPTVGTGSVTFGVPAGSLLKTTGENSLITLQPKGSVNDLAVWGSLESSEGSLATTFSTAEGQDGLVVPLDEAYGLTDLLKYPNHHISAIGASDLTWTLRDTLSGMGGKKLSITNKSVFTLTLNTESTNATIWDKGTDVNTTDVLSNETVSFLHDGSDWVVTNRY